MKPNGCDRWKARLKAFKELLTGLTDRELKNMISLQTQQGDGMLERLALDEMARRWHD
jgi:hypothetical protein